MSLVTCQLAHARARDAVHERLDVAALTLALAPLGRETLSLRSAAPERAVYLRRLEVVLGDALEGRGEYHRRYANPLPARYQRYDGQGRLLQAQPRQGERAQADALEQ